MENVDRLIEVKEGMCGYGIDESERDEKIRIFGCEDGKLIRVG